MTKFSFGQKVRYSDSYYRRQIMEHRPSSSPLLQERWLKKLTATAVVIGISRENSHDYTILFEDGEQEVVSDAILKAV